MTEQITQLLNSKSILEKRKDYKKLVILQVFIIITALLVKELFVLSGLDQDLVYKFRDLVFMTLVGVYVFILWDLLRNFIQNKVFLSVLFIVIVITLTVMLFVAYPFHPLFDSEKKTQPYLLLIHINLFVLETIVIYFTIMDIFSGNRLSHEKLWGSACIYLMIGLSFGSMYDLITILDPGCMGIPIKLGIDSYITGIFYSMATIGGHDAYSDAIPFIHNLGVVEAVWSTLFIALLVGRMLGRPEE